MIAVGIFLVGATTVAFIVSWCRLKGEFREGYEWAICCVPLSLFFDVLRERGCKWRYVNLVSAFMLSVAIMLLLAAIYDS